MADAGPSTPRRSKRHEVPTSPAAGPSEPRPSKVPRFMLSVAGPLEPWSSGRHDVAMSEATRPSESEPARIIPCAPRPTPLCLLRGRPDPSQETNRDLEDYNIRSEERTQLLTDLEAAMNDSPVTPAFWACCQLCNKSTLRVLVQDALFNPDMMSPYIQDSSLIPSLCELPALRLYCRDTHG